MYTRPYVVCHMQASIDGRISGEFFFTPQAEAVYGKDNDIRNSYNADAIVNGAVTCAEIYADGFLARRPAVPDGGCRKFPREDCAAAPHADRFIVCIDTKGTLQWHGSSISHRGNPDAHVIEVLTEDVDDAYLAYLRGLRISYIFAGKANLDLELALHKLHTLFGIKRMLLTGGGQTNRTFLDAGCIDELNLVILPFVDGSADSAEIIDRPSGNRFCDAFARFTLTRTEQLPGDCVLLTYKRTVSAV